MKSPSLLLPWLALALFFHLSSASTLTLCPPDYFFDVQHCEACSPHCTCSTAGTCVSCVAGYTMSAGVCIQCPQASGLYGACSSCCSRTSGTLLSCTDCLNSNNQYAFLYSGRCIISSGCFQIDSNGFCLQCVSGFYEVDNLCHACDNSCKTCTDSINCISCANGYYWGLSNLGLCTSCPTGCNTCDATGNCTSCLSAFYFYQDHCLNCPTNCSVCSDGSTCLTCNVGILVSNLCIVCEDSTYGGSVGCTSCYESNNFIVCSSCADLYYLDPNGICKSCATYISGAVRCRDQNTPTQCQNDYSSSLAARYYLVGITCVPNANSCRKIADIYGNCSLCYSNYVLTAGSCVACTYSGCVLANSSVLANVCTCTVCLSGYYLPVASAACSACSTLNCAYCPLNVCSKCVAGFYWGGASCLASTSPNCLVASTASLCSVCQPGYYLGSNSLCFSCQSNCLLCTGRFVCSSCSNGQYLKGGVCVSQPSNCASLASNGTCSLCNYGYYLTEGVCLSCLIEEGTVTSIYLFIAKQLLRIVSD